MEKLTLRIFIALVVGITLGLVLHHLPPSVWRDRYLLKVIGFIGNLFIDIIKIIVIPVVFFSLSAGVCAMPSGARLGKMALKTVLLYLATTVVAIALGLIFASLFRIGVGHQPQHMVPVEGIQSVSLWQNLKSIFFGNPLKAFTGDNMLQLIVFAIIIGLLIKFFSTRLASLRRFIIRTNDILLTLVFWFLLTAPYGIFCLITVVFARSGFGLVGYLLAYFFTVLFVLAIQWLGFYTLLLKLFTQRSIKHFFQQMRSAILFAFSVSSSNASIPIVLETCEEKLGIRNQTAAFVIPLGATINMDGTAIMQGVATVFVANLYAVHLSFLNYIVIVIMATLASIGAAGVPSMGLITLTMVFQQVGLPVEGIALILGIDRLLDMARTAVNITGDCVVASIVDR